MSWRRPAGGTRRCDVRAMLADPASRRDLLVSAGLFLQHVEGIGTTREQMEAAYDRIREPNKPA